MTPAQGQTVHLRSAKWRPLTFVGEEALPGRVVWHVRESEIAYPVEAFVEEPWRPGVRLRPWATFSPCERYRYSLGRPLILDPQVLRVLAVIMLNPSTATEILNDPTIRRVVGYGKAWGYTLAEIGNIFAYRSPDPKDLDKVDDPVGPENDAALEAMVRAADGVVVAWGSNGWRKRRGEIVAEKLRAWGVTPLCLGTTKDGEPLHPLYLRKDAQLRPYTRSAA